MSYFEWNYCLILPRLTGKLISLISSSKFELRNDILLFFVYFTIIFVISYKVAIRTSIIKDPITDLDRVRKSSFFIVFLNHQKKKMINLQCYYSVHV